MEHDPVIYFVSTRRPDAPIKIGRTTRKSLLRRFSQLQVGMSDTMDALLVCPGTADDEAALHDRFARDHLSGEWFRRTASLMAEIAARTTDPYWRDEYGVGHRWSIAPLVTRKQLAAFPLKERPVFVRLAY